MASTLATNTIKAASLFAGKSAPDGLVSAAALALAQGAMQTMPIKKWTMAALMLLLVGGVASGLGFLAYAPRAGQAEAGKADPRRDDPKQDEVKEVEPRIELAGKFEQAKELGKDALGDPLPAGAIVRLGTQRWRTFESPLLFSRNGHFAVAAGGKPWLIDATTGKMLREFDVMAARGAFLKPDDKTLIVAGDQETKLFPGRWPVFLGYRDRQGVAAGCRSPGPPTPATPGPPTANGWPAGSRYPKRQPGQPRT